MLVAFVAVVRLTRCGGLQRDPRCNKSLRTDAAKNVERYEHYRNNFVSTSHVSSAQFKAAIPVCQLSRSRLQGRAILLATCSALLRFLRHLTMRFSHADILRCGLLIDAN